MLGTSCSGSEELAQLKIWNECAALLHLREALREDAPGCGQATTVQEIFEVLIAQFGIALREARKHPNTFRKEARNSLQERATEAQ